MMMASAIPLAAKGAKGVHVPSPWSSLIQIRRACNSTHGCHLQKKNRIHVRLRKPTQIKSQIKVNRKSL
jgi:hypothetical protein